MTNALRVLVLAGGSSEEREVSLNSARAVVGGLQRLGHSVAALDPASGKALLGNDGKFLPAAADGSAETHALASVNERALIDSLAALRVDVVFLALHGGAGEDGTLQTLLDLAQTRYTGSGRVASTVAISKPLTKRIARDLKITTPDWIEFNGQSELETQMRERIVREFGFPVIIKPTDSGSTVGLTLVREESALAAACGEALALTGRALAEEFVAGRELTVAVFDGEAWPVVEIRPKSGLYDYEAKYTSGGSEYFCPADIPRETAEEIQESSVKLYRALGCRGLSRVDFILPEQGPAQLLEINTIPGMTELSLAPMAAKAAGIDFEQLLQKMLDSALIQ